MEKFTNIGIIQNAEEHGHSLRTYQTVSEVLFNDEYLSIEPPKSENPDDFMKEEGLSSYFYKITEISYEKDFPRRESFQNVIASINNPNFNFVYMLSGTPIGVSIYVGITNNYFSKNSGSKITAFDVTQAMITSLEGNFMGTKSQKLDKEEIENEIIKPIYESKRKSFIYGIPSVNKDEKGEINNFQGIDRLINSMQGETYQLLIVCEPVDRAEILKLTEQVYNLYNELNPHAEFDLSANKSDSQSETKGSSYSRSKNKGTSQSRSDGYSSTSGDNYNDSKSTSTGTSESSSNNNSTTQSTQTGKTVNLKIIDKKLKEKIEYIDKEFLPRLQQGRAKTMYRTAIYAMGKTLAGLEKLEGNISSIFQGSKSTFSPLTAGKLFRNGFEGARLEDDVSLLLRKFQVLATRAYANPNTYLMHGMETSGEQVRLSTLLTPDELSLIGGLPQSEVPGLSLNEAVDFGVNLPTSSQGIELGSILHRGNIIKNKVSIDKELLKKHIFITGVTGSGKTTTCQNILIGAGMPFLVIEPAKTEYRQLISRMKNVQLYTVGRNDICPLRINPLELIQGESLASHIDLLMATFQAVYPMEASMPYILKESIVKTYEKLGWNLEANENIYSADPWAEDGLYWPMLSNVIAELKNSIEAKNFASELKSNYLASMVSRFNDLIINTRGSIFNVPLSIDFEKLITQNTIIELEEIKSEEDKILLMGLILTRVSEAVKNAHKKNPNFRHITLIEEAHRLLAKAEPGEENKKHGIQTFTDMLAEIRRYGESLIIVDQIPGKLTSEVMKNTNTKIVHKLFAEDDKTAIKHCIALDDKQKDFLSKLNVGEAIVYTEGWHKPVCVKIKYSEAFGIAILDENALQEKGMEMLMEQKDRFLPAFRKITLTKQGLVYFLKNRNRLHKILFQMFEKPDSENAPSVHQTFNELGEYFTLNRDFFNALGTEYWGLIKTSSVGRDFKKQTKNNIDYITDAIEHLYKDGYIVKPESEAVHSEFIAFVNNLKTKKITY